MLERGPGLATETHVLGTNPLTLAPYMLGLSEDAERQRGRFGLYADLIESTPLVRVSADAGLEPRQLADLIEDALEHRPALTGIGT